MKKKTKTWQAWTMLEVRYLKRHFEDKTIQEMALHLKRFEKIASVDSSRT
jgi:hypothetical protein